MEWLPDNRIKIDPPKRPKKITGTRFASILGLNRWATPFQAWCEVTRTYEKPFEDTIYTKAGKVIEPKQADYMRRAYAMNDLLTPENVWGKDFFKKTYGDFFKQDRIFGGMWDYVLGAENNAYAVLEMKTTKRAEDWQGDIPEYYAMQAALYAYLLNVDQVYMVCSFLSDGDYDHPDAFIPTAENTIVRPFKLSERYPDFEQTIEKARWWWRDHVESGISPEYDEIKDAEYLKVLRTTSYNPQTDLADLIREAKELSHKIESKSKEIESLINRTNAIRAILKEALTLQLRDGDKRAETSAHGVTWTLTRTPQTKADVEQIKKDGLADKYLTTTETLKLTYKENDNGQN